MKRDLTALTSQQFDVLVIGGGINGGVPVALRSGTCGPNNTSASRAGRCDDVPMNLNLAQILKITTTGALLYLVLRAVDFSRIRHDLSKLEMHRLALLVVVYWFAQAICAQRWRLFASSLAIRERYLSFLKTYFIGMFFNVGLPLVGGDVIKAYIITTKTKTRLSNGLASVLQDRTAGLLALFSLGTVAVSCSALNWRGMSLRYIYLSGWIGIIGAIAFARGAHRLYHRGSTQGYVPLLQKILRGLAEFDHAVTTVKLRPIGILQVSALSLLNSALVIAIAWGMVTGAGQAVKIVQFIALYPLIDIATVIPLSVSGIGVREWAYVEALAVLGISAETALTVGISMSALLIVRNLAGAFFLPSIPEELKPWPRTGKR